MNQIMIACCRSTPCKITSAASFGCNIPAANPYRADSYAISLFLQNTQGCAYFFLFATVLFGPFLVLALVLVFWPRTGRPFLWRIPR